MRFMIESDDPKCFDAMKKFAEEFKEEYSKQMSSLKLRIIRKFVKFPENLLSLDAFVMKEGKKIYLIIPISLPDFKLLREAVRIVTGRDMEPKWKERLIKSLEGYLRKTGISYNKIEYAGD